MSDKKMSKNNDRIQVYLPSLLKNQIKNMAEETGMTQNQLTLMALQSLVANYERKGSFIFADLLNPDIKK
jgi:hypothetical protein